MRQLQEHPDMWQRVDAILETSSSSNSKFFALQVRLRRLASAVLQRERPSRAAAARWTGLEPRAVPGSSHRAVLPPRKRRQAGPPGLLARLFSSFLGPVGRCMRLRARVRPAGREGELCAARGLESFSRRPPHARSTPHPPAPAQVLESVIKYRWMSLPAEQREGIKNYIASVVIKARHADGSRAAPRAAAHPSPSPDV